jgi:hypothetical protein
VLAQPSHQLAVTLWGARERLPQCEPANAGIHLVLGHIDTDDNAIILCHHPLPSLLGTGSKPLQLFGLRKTPELSLALIQALMPLGRYGLSSSDGRFCDNRPFAHSARLSGHKGRFAIVTNVEAGGGGRETSQHSFSDADERGLADGEAVWSWRPDAGVKLVTMRAASHRRW